jgi:hypothetical protein
MKWFRENWLIIVVVIILFILGLACPPSFGIIQPGGWDGAIIIFHNVEDSCTDAEKRVRNGVNDGREGTNTATGEARELR